MASLPPESVIFGSSEHMRLVRYKVERLASSDAPVLIGGESGTGKEVLAKFIHSRSPWANGPFVKVSCPAIPGTLLESELFGYERGAFTGAYGQKKGRIELAHRGTLFLDEIAELDPALQAKLLQLLQDGEFCRIGGRENTRVDVRVVCATNRKLQQEIKAGTFREDLFYRISVIDVNLPPLRERKEDIPPLVDYFVGCYSQKYSANVRPVSAEFVKMLQHHDWPGNIRELENVTRRYVIFGDEQDIITNMLMAPLDPMAICMPINGEVQLKQLIRQAAQNIERVVLRKALQENNWNRRRAALALGISYRALLYKIKGAGLPSKGMRRVQEDVVRSEKEAPRLDGSRAKE